MKNATFAFLLLGVQFVASATAAPITFLHRGSGEGYIGGHRFDASPFTITAHADTTNLISPIPSVLYLDHTSAFISIAGVGEFQFLSPTRTFINAENNHVGFSRAGSAGLDLFDGPTHPAFGAWDMLSSIGPFDGNDGLLVQWTHEPTIQTSGGILGFFNSFQLTARFQAIVVPEQASLPLLALSLAQLFRRPSSRGRSLATDASDL